MNNLIRYFFALFLFFLTTLAEGETIFKWVDDQGVTHYSAGAPSSKNVQQLKPQPAPASEGGNQPSAVRDWIENENVKKYKQRRDQQEAADNRRKDDKARRCAIAKDNLNMLQNARRVYKYNEKGEKEYWDDSARDAEIKRLKEEIEGNC